jgi:hypothetical protein
LKILQLQLQTAFLNLELSAKLANFAKGNLKLQEVFKEMVQEAEVQLASTVLFRPKMQSLVNSLN